MTTLHGVLRTRDPSGICSLIYVTSPESEPSRQFRAEKCLLAPSFLAQERPFQWQILSSHPLQVLLKHGCQLTPGRAVGASKHAGLVQVPALGQSQGWGPGWGGGVSLRNHSQSPRFGALLQAGKTSSVKTRDSSHHVNSRFIYRSE